MRNITEFAVRYRLLIVVIGFVAAVAGGAALWRAPVNLLPNLSPTMVEVQTEALGLSAGEVEAMITVPLEADMLNGVPWLDRLESQSITGLSSIQMFFEPGVDLLVARQMVQERLTAAHALPNVSKPPVMRQPVATDARIAQIGLTSDQLSLIDLSVLARWTIRPRLSSVPGVAHISIWGERQRQMQVQVNPDVLAANQVLLEDVVRTAGNALWVSPLSYLEASTPGTGGFIDTPNQRLGIQHVFPIVEPGDMMGLALVGSPGRSIGDVAEVVEGHQPLIGDSLINGKPGLLLVVEKFPWADSADVARDVGRAMEQMQPGLSGVDVDLNSFSAGEIAVTAANQLRLVGLVGLVAALALVAIATRSWRVTTVAAVTAGAAVLATGGLAIGAAGSVNGALVAGMFAGLGLVLHDAVQASLSTDANGGSRLRPTMILSTLAAILVAVPLFFVNGVGGIVTAESAWSYVLTVAVSLVAGLFLAAAVATLLGGNGHAAAGMLLRGRTKAGGMAFLPSLAICIVLLVGGAVVVGLSSLAAVPSFRNQNVLVEWTSPPGTSIEAVRSAGQGLSETLLQGDAVDHAVLQVGRAENSDEVLNANAGSLWLTLSPGVAPAAAEAEIRALAANAGLAANVTSYQDRQISRASGAKSAADIIVRVYGHEYDRLSQKAGEIAGLLLAVNGVDAAEVRSLQVEPIIEVEVNLANAAKYRAKPGDVRRAIAALVGGIEVGSLFENQKVFNVVVWGDASRRSSIEAMKSALIDVPGGGSVPLSELADVRVADAPAFINRSSVSRFIEIAVTAPNAGSSVVREVESVLASVDYPLEYHAEVTGGTVLEAGNGGAALWQVAVASLVGILLLMQVSLESWSRAGLAIVYAGAVGGIAALACFVLGAWTSAAAIGAVAAIGIGLRDAATGMQDENATSTLLLANAAGIVALLPAIVLFTPGLEFVWPTAVALAAGSVGSAALSLFVLPGLARGMGETGASALVAEGV